MKKAFLLFAALLLAPLSFAQQATVTATITAYAGGSARALFLPQGGGSPTVTQASGNINASGVFSLSTWNNTYAGYAPSVTKFTICAPFPNASTCYSAIVSITSSSQDISSSFSGAPTPPGGNAVSSVFGRTGAVVAQSSDYSADYDALGAATAAVSAFTAAVGTVTWNSSGTCTYAVGGSYIGFGTVTSVSGQTCTLSPTGLVAGGSYTLKIINASGSAATLTLGTAGSCSAWKVGGGGSGAVTLSGSSEIDVLAFIFDGTNCLANFRGNFS